MKAIRENVETWARGLVLGAGVSRAVADATRSGELAGEDLGDSLLLAGEVLVGGVSVSVRLEAPADLFAPGGPAADASR